jgi:hypothetical protein
MEGDIMEGDKNGGRQKWKETKMEGDKNGRRQKWKETKMEGDKMEGDEENHHSVWPRGQECRPQSRRLLIENVLLLLVLSV